MDNNRIKQEMLRLSQLLEFNFKDINNLAKAMDARRKHIPNEGKNHKEWENDALATVGDALLKAILADILYLDNHKSKGEISIMKSEKECNKVLYEIANEKGISKFAYNENYFLKDNPPKESLVSNSSHNQYIEAIIAAMYYDAGFEKTKDWVISWLYPLI